MSKLLYIERLVIAVLLLLLLALAPAMAQNVVDKGGYSTLAVEQKGDDQYEWELYNIDNVNFATDAGTAVANGDAGFVGSNKGASVTVLWNQPGIFFFKVTAVDAKGCTNNIKIGKMEVKDVNLLMARITLREPLGVCAGKSVSFEVTFTGKGKGPWDFTYTDGTKEWEVKDVKANPYVLKPDHIPNKTTDYWITKVKDEFNTVNKNPGNTITQKINPLPNPSDISVRYAMAGGNTCIGPYLYEVSTAKDHDYLWSVNGGIEGKDYTISGQTTVSATITWMNPSTTKTFTVIFTETDPVTHCTNDVHHDVTVHPLAEATIAYSPSTFCATGIASVTLVILNGQPEGTYSSTDGLIINQLTGEVDRAASNPTSTPNRYTVNYSYTSGTCIKTATTTIIIKPVPHTSPIFEETVNAK